jgi:hypothetical protein
MDVMLDAAACFGQWRRVAGRERGFHIKRPSTEEEGLDLLERGGVRSVWCRC